MLSSLHISVFLQIFIQCLIFKVDGSANDCPLSEQRCQRSTTFRDATDPRSKFITNIKTIRSTTTRTITAPTTIWNTATSFTTSTVTKTIRNNSIAIATTTVTTKIVLSSTSWTTITSIDISETLSQTVVFFVTTLGTECQRITTTINRAEVSTLIIPATKSSSSYVPVLSVITILSTLTQTTGQTISVIPTTLFVPTEVVEVVTGSTIFAPFIVSPVFTRTVPIVAAVGSTTNTITSIITIFTTITQTSYSLIFATVYGATTIVSPTVFGRNTSTFPLTVSYDIA